MRLFPKRPPKIESDFPARGKTAGPCYTNRIGEVVKADDYAFNSEYGRLNSFGVFRKGKRVQTLPYQEAKQEYDYELNKNVT
jgi:hypothetical protein